MINCDGLLVENFDFFAHHVIVHAGGTGTAANIRWACTMEWMMELLIDRLRTVLKIAEYREEVVTTKLLWVSAVQMYNSCYKKIMKKLKNISEYHWRVDISLVRINAHIRSPGTWTAQILQLLEGINIYIFQYVNSNICVWINASSFSCPFPNKCSYSQTTDNILTMEMALAYSLLVYSRFCKKILRWEAMAFQLVKNP